MSFIPGGTSRLYLEEISEPDHFRCTQENPQQGGGVKTPATIAKETK